MIGNAHIDPVWLWRFGDGLAEIKATFRSALDRIKEYDDFIFTSASAFYYQWIEESCPDMFEEIRAAVANGKWKIVGGMWVQPDCNMPSSESFARHLLYSQRYFYEKFGVIAKSGYNVDSFGHSAALPALLSQGRIENYLFMRPANGEEMDYPFSCNAFRWKYGEDEVVAFHLNDYCMSLPQLQSKIARYEDAADVSPTDLMMFYGVGNHGGGPTVQQIEYLSEFRKNARHDYIFSDPDAYFDSLRQTGQSDQIPEYRGELQNHASGCYSANSEIKRLNRRAESVLGESETLCSLSQALTSFHSDHSALKKAWQTLLFNQFHDILCGCSIEPAMNDAYAFVGGAIGEGLKQGMSAMQKISWNIDTSKGVTVLHKEGKGDFWEQDDLGTPLVVFNPLAHSVRVPVKLAPAYDCASVTDEYGNAIPYQRVLSDFAIFPEPRNQTLFLAEIPPLGWRTYWHYRFKEHVLPEMAPKVIAEEHLLANDKIEVHFDPLTGEIKAIYTRDGQKISGDFSARAIVIDDNQSDTWAHGRFVFDKQIGTFAKPVFTVIEQGACIATLRVRQSWHNSTIEQTYSLYAEDDRIHVQVRVTLLDPTVMVKLCFDSGITDADWLREIPGGMIATKQNEREMPMLRTMAMKKDDRFFAVVNNGKYSCSATNGEMRMVAARSCYFADHYGRKLHENMRLQDLGEQTFSYTILPGAHTLSEITHAAEELHADFTMIPETYHKGELPQTACHWSCDTPNVSILAWKNAEDGNGSILRVQETEGKATKCNARLMGTELAIELPPHGIRSFRIQENKVTSCDFIEWDAAT